MIITAILYMIQIIKPLSHKTKTEKLLLYGCGLVVIVFPMARLGGVLHQTHRGEGYIKGPCVQYHFETQRLMASPFNLKCLNYADWLLLISSGLGPIGAIVYIFYTKQVETVEKTIKRFKSNKYACEKFHTMKIARNFFNQPKYIQHLIKDHTNVVYTDPTTGAKVSLSNISFFGDVVPDALAIDFKQKPKSEDRCELLWNKFKTGFTECKSAVCRFIKVDLFGMKPPHSNRLESLPLLRYETARFMKRITNLEGLPSPTDPKITISDKISKFFRSCPLQCGNDDENHQSRKNYGIIEKVLEKEDKDQRILYLLITTLDYGLQPENFDEKKYIPDECCEAIKNIITFGADILR